MKLQEKVKIVKFGELKDFEVGEDVKIENMEFLGEREITMECTVNKRLEGLEFNKKSYPGLNVLESMVSWEYKDYHRVDDNGNYVTLTPIYIMNVEDGELQFIFNDKEKLKYSDFYRDLQKNVDSWFVGYIYDESNFIEVDSSKYYTKLKYLDDKAILRDHVYVYLMKIMENPNLDFRHLPFTEFDIAKEIYLKDLNYEDITQEFLNNYRIGD